MGKNSTFLFILSTVTTISFTCCKLKDRKTNLRNDTFTVGRLTNQTKDTLDYKTGERDAPWFDLIEVVKANNKTDYEVMDENATMKKQFLLHQTEKK